MSRLVRTGPGKLHEGSPSAPRKEPPYWYQAITLPAVEWEVQPQKQTKQGDSREGVVTRCFLVPMRGTPHHLVPYGSKQGGSPTYKAGLCSFSQCYIHRNGARRTRTVQSQARIFLPNRFIHHQKLLRPRNKSSMQHSRNRRAVKPSSNIDGPATGAEGIADTFIGVRDDLCVILRDG